MVTSRCDKRDIKGRFSQIFSSYKVKQSGEQVSRFIKPIWSLNDPELRLIFEINS